jgi:hypothetical protein
MNIEEKLVKVQELLLALGETPEQIASNLLAQGCRGEMGESLGCPVAILLVKHSLDEFRVGNIRVTISDPFDGYVSCDMPVAIRSFIETFDSGRFPELQLDSSSQKDTST